MILFIPFMLLEVPLNIIRKKSRLYRWLSAPTVGCGEHLSECSNAQYSGNRRQWTGVFSLSIDFTNSFAALTGVHFLLGCSEAGIGAGCIFVISS